MGFGPWTLGFGFGKRRGLTAKTPRSPRLEGRRIQFKSQRGKGMRKARGVRRKVVREKRWREGFYGGDFFRMLAVNVITCELV
jgi:hypothetical protein